MRRWVMRVFVVVLCAAVCVSTAAVSSWPSSGSVRTEDRNGDGRPDVWRTYDRQGQLTQIAVDTNFDGRSDVLEFYDRGALVRRESDRNFDGRVDLIESFDRTTHERVRAVADVDYDGRADLLLLFRDGRVVYAKRAAPVANATATSGFSPHAGIPPGRGESLWPLDDPFLADLAVQAHDRARGPEDGGAVPISGAMPAVLSDLVASPTPSSHGSTSDLSLRPSAAAGLCSPRGPPAFRLTT
jgi:hypothetical protein